jgi:hypothetical protein
MLYVMLVGAYPFERPEDKTDSQKLQKMIQVGVLVCWRLLLLLLLLRLSACARSRGCAAVSSLRRCVCVCHAALQLTNRQPTNRPTNQPTAHPQG